MHNTLIKSSVILLLSGIFLMPLQAKGKQWQLVWADEFNYEELPDPAKWNYR